ncbi:MAG: UDP-N-acetylglucosamine 2-epimerase [Rhodospirillales bacterium]
MTPELRICTVVGARPQFIKAAMVNRAIETAASGGNAGIDEDLLHTGQHFDDNMSDVFFRELAIPKPTANLGINSGSHAAMTAEMLVALEGEFLRRGPGLVLVYGDTDSTLAAALAAAKLRIPVAHIEAGPRTFNHEHPEEINRLITDHISDLRFCPTEHARENLSREGIEDGASANVVHTL